MIQCLAINIVLASESKAQKKSLKDIYLTVGFNQRPLSEVFNVIESVTDFEFTYYRKELPNVKLTIDRSERSLAQILYLIAEQAGLKFKRVDENIFISRNPGDKGKKKVGPLVTEVIEVSGTVTDESGEGLPGVSIVAKGTTIGTTTDKNGYYTLNVPDDATLVFTYIGYLKEEIFVGTQTTINVVMVPDIEQLDEVVVVGFGTQKKESVVGSLSSVQPSELRIPASNLTTALTGRMAGLISYQRSGEPGEDNAQFFVRGVTTFGLTRSPLILIDGVELSIDDLARLHPDDIESFSILKDATTTSIFGARGANGIILVTTKEGVQGKAKVSVRLENSFSSPIKNIKFTDPISYMRLHNEAVRTRNPIEALPYSETKIANTIAGTNPVVFPATNWQQELFKDQTTTQRANVNVTGGGDIVRYYLATSFNKDNGILRVDDRNDFNSNVDLRRIAVRSNVNIDLTPSTEMIIRFNGTFDDYRGPIDGANDIYYKVLRTNPVLYPKYYEPDEDNQFKRHILFGNIGGTNGQFGLNPYADLMKGYREYSRTLLLSQFEIKQDLTAITEGLSGHIFVNTNRRSFFDIRRQYVPFFYSALYNKEAKTHTLQPLNEEEGRENLDYSEGPTDVSTTFYLQASLNYNKVFNEKHDVGGLLVYLQTSSLTNNAGNLQKSLPFRNMGLSGRFTYGYNRKYFVEFNFGYNGSERFAKDNRFGFFPSFGIGWTVSEEPFFAGLKPIISRLRLRASYGLVGNDAIGTADDRFFYLSQVNLNNGGRGSRFGIDLDNFQSGVSIDRYENELISWETATKINFGLEIDLFNDKVIILADVFKENRDNILMDRAFIPPSMGLEAAVRANVGKAESHGVDFSIDYNEDLGNSWWITGRVNFTYAVGKFKLFEEPDYSETAPWLSHNGQPITQQWGYVAERLFVDEAEVLNSPTQIGEYGAGDIKYKDINEDGIIDFRDQVPIGYPTSPEIVYGFGLSMGYKNFDLSAFFQGSARYSFWIDPVATAPFVDPPDNSIENNALLQVYANSHWSEENQDIYALWPRLSPQIVENNTQTSTWFMRDGAFIRLKQLEIGYTLPETLTNKWKIPKMRIYGGGVNLLTFSKFKLWDPEMAGNGLAYPIQKVYNMGLMVSF
ncbi:SusC/RagA family TonB-linked outer membrane protein [Fulvivirgaceae bacterium BMA12]|uniref:SusC/RagA family TonB-linked outer membrane protein n=1 Tax=Agaribacillus aureus TaxID=3051825 RepID=A0ABT8LDU2_9BACT|nr:SusC/RagA family TonB-linked outer membrane protein [Fulvivirgaceae bacterium BMA12]